MSIAGIAKTGLNYASRLILDDKFSSRVTASIKMFRKQKKAGVYSGNFGNIVKDSFVRAGKKTNPNVWGALRESVTSYGTETAALWKSNKGIFSKLGGTFKGLTKRAPLIGAILTVAFEIPNVYRAIKDGGLIYGATEVAKSGVRLATGIAAGAIGAAFLGPVGAFAGYFIGDWLGKLVVGKSHTEKLAEQEEKQQEQLAQFMTLQDAAINEQAALAQLQGAQGAGYQQTPAFTSFLPQATMTPDQLQAYGNALYGGGGMNNFLTQSAYNQGLQQPKLNYFG
ncbi:MAG: hypothetical protein E7Z93_02820 [Cyanobacteria bacterium SIG32]|nr:hypothetical protein [Cyanobacteria bacterium SIG32]